MPAEPIGDDNPIEAILLTAFPNPERLGCPSPDVIKAMANQQIGRDDPAWSHIWKCSPCFQNFKIVRDERVARVERDHERKRTRRNILKSAVVILALSLLAYFGGVEFRTRSRAPLVVSVDLTDAGPTRGTEQEPPPISRFPRQLEEIHFMLPRFSPLGPYIVAILESRLENTAIALGSANAREVNKRQVLIVTLDLSEVRPGQYFLGIRRDGNGHQEVPSYYPILISN